MHLGKGRQEDPYVFNTFPTLPGVPGVPGLPAVPGILGVPNTKSFSRSHYSHFARINANSSFGMPNQSQLSLQEFCNSAKKEANYLMMLKDGSSSATRWGEPKESQQNEIPPRIALRKTPLNRRTRIKQRVDDTIPSGGMAHVPPPRAQRHRATIPPSRPKCRLSWFSHAVCVECVIAGNVDDNVCDPGMF